MGRENIKHLSVEEYLTLEKSSQIRHEYVDGRVYAMTGTTIRHNKITGNLFAILRSHMRGSGCGTYFTDIKVHVEAMNGFYYPDVVVSCEKSDDDASILQNPVLIVEVLSRSTAQIDRREKVFAYRKLPSLKAYVIIYQSKKMIELHTRNTDMTWSLVSIIPDATVVLEGIGQRPIEMSFDEIYEDVPGYDNTTPAVRERGPEYSADDGMDW